MSIMSNFSATCIHVHISWWEQVAFQLDDDDDGALFVLDQHY
jgi:hypothetical protein